MHHTCLCNNNLLGNGPALFSCGSFVAEFGLNNFQETVNLDWWVDRLVLVSKRVVFPFSGTTQNLLDCPF